MDSLLEFLSNWAGSIWGMLIDSAFLLMVGLLLAGLIHIWLHERNVSRFFAGRPGIDVLKAALFGIPLPLCSCAVLPVAHQLRRSGMSRGGTTAFLISTPESGVDSILLTYSLTDPIMTVARPVTAFLTAMTAGLIETVFPDRTPATNETTPPAAPLSPVEKQASEDDSCGCLPVLENDSNASIIQRMWQSTRYAFTDLLGDLAVYLLVGYLLAGLVATLLGPEMLQLSEAVKTGWGGYAAAVLVGLPLYVCATSSTPLAAALLAVGFSPGAVLVFMMVGPATNVASMVVVSRILGRPALARYLASILLVSVLCGLILDRVYAWYDIETTFQLTAVGNEIGLFSTACAVVLSLMILYQVLKKPVKQLFPR